MKNKSIVIKIPISLLIIIVTIATIATIYFGCTITKKTFSVPKESELGDFPITYLC